MDPESGSGRKMGGRGFNPRIHEGRINAASAAEVANPYLRG
jgi:hypothetical protein